MNRLIDRGLSRLCLFYEENLPEGIDEMLLVGGFFILLTLCYVILTPLAIVGWTLRKLLGR